MNYTQTASIADDCLHYWLNERRTSSGCSAYTARGTWSRRRSVFQLHILHDVRVLVVSKSSVEVRLTRKLKAGKATSEGILL